MSGQPPLTAVFIDTSTGTPTEWTWNFGDGTVATGPNPSHIYSQAGVNTVTLTVSNEHGISQVAKKNYI